MKPVCPSCEGKNVMFKKTTNSFWCRRCGKEWKKSKTPRNHPWKSAVVILIILLTAGNCYAYTDKEAVRAIIGEASNQGFDGMWAVASGIRNRGNLKGVYGLKAKHVDNEPKWVWELAKKAWEQSAQKDRVKGANHWEAIKKYGKPKWADKMQLTCIVGEHYFYKGGK